MEALVTWTAIFWNVGEFVGSIAVLATLVYLAVQVRHSRDMLEENRKIALAQTYQARAQMASQQALLNDSLSASPNLVRLDIYQLSVEDLSKYSEVELAVIRQRLQLAIISMDNVFYQDRLGLVDNAMVVGGRRLLARIRPVLIELDVMILPEVRRALVEMGFPDDGTGQSA